ncbi:MAG: hypothetical protein AAF542_25350 [Pseudomonadota bacterium]
MKRVCLSILLFLPSIGFAAGTYTDEKVKRVHVSPSGGYYFQTISAMQNPDGCVSSGWYYITPTESYADDAYALVLAALATGDKIQFSISGCSSNYPKLSWINTYE